MTDQQMYIAVGLPLVAILIGILTNVGLYIHLSTRLDAQGSQLRSEMSALRGEMAALRGDIGDRFESLEKLFDAKLSRVEEVLDARLKHLEER